MGLKSLKFKGLDLFGINAINVALMALEIIPTILDSSKTLNNSFASRSKKSR
jgi:hypothetical protein